MFSIKDVLWIACVMGLTAFLTTGCDQSSPSSGATKNSTQKKTARTPEEEYEYHGPDRATMQKLYRKQKQAFKNANWTTYLECYPKQKRRLAVAVIYARTHLRLLRREDSGSEIKQRVQSIREQYGARPFPEVSEFTDLVSRVTSDNKQAISRLTAFVKPVQNLAEFCGDLLKVLVRDLGAHRYDIGSSRLLSTSFADAKHTGFLSYRVPLGDKNQSSQRVTLKTKYIDGNWYISPIQ